MYAVAHHPRAPHNRSTVVDNPIMIAVAVVFAVAVVIAIIL